MVYISEDYRELSCGECSYCLPGKIRISRIEEGLLKDKREKGKIVEFYDIVIKLLENEKKKLEEKIEEKDSISIKLEKFIRTGKMPKISIEPWK